LCLREKLTAVIIYLQVFYIKKQNIDVKNIANFSASHATFAVISVLPAKSITNMSVKKFILVLTVAAVAGTAFVSDRSGSYAPVYMSREMLDNSVKYIPEARDMKQTGKIFYRYPYIFINERYKGVHVINNTDPAHPVSEGFVLAPGCIDMAVKDNILYLDNAVDLVSFDMDGKQVTKRIRNVFPEPIPPDNFYSRYYYERPEGYIIVEWKKSEY
jgi:hypothetical protein